MLQVGSCNYVIMCYYVHRQGHRRIAGVPIPRSAVFDVFEWEWVHCYSQQHKSRSKKWLTERQINHLYSVSSLVVQSTSMAPSDKVLCFGYIWRMWLMQQTHVYISQNNGMTSISKNLVILYPVTCAFQCGGKRRWWAKKENNKLQDSTEFHITTALSKSLWGNQAY